MDLTFRPEIAGMCKSGSQTARRLTKDWAARSLFCPKCGESGLRHFPNNTRVADFHCLACREEYELKSQGRAFGRLAEYGALGAMLSGIAAHNQSKLHLPAL